VYRYDWYHDRVEFYVDGVLIVTNINNAPGYNNSNNIPDVPGKVTIGPWFPSSATPWAGTVANFSVEKMYVRSFKYTPFTDEIANYQVIVGETYGTYRSLSPGSGSV
jgi:beta-glucanase (GH16 family)